MIICAYSCIGSILRLMYSNGIEHIFDLRSGAYIGIGASLKASPNIEAAKSPQVKHQTPILSFSRSLSLH